MGNTVSCFDPVREHPPYSWPKDHPDRAAAIAERKLARQNRKVIGAQSNARTVERDPPNQPAPTSTDLPEKSLGETTPISDTSPIQDSTVPPLAGKDADKDLDIPDALEVPDISEDLDNILDHPLLESDANKDITLVPAQVVDNDFDDNSIDEFADVGERAEETFDDTALHSPIDDDSPLTDNLQATGVTDATEDDVVRPPSDTLDATEPLEALEQSDDNSNLNTLGAAVTDSNEILADDALLDEPEPIAVKVEPETEDTFISSIDDRRAVFNREEDVLPNPKEIQRDVLDPVTNEYVTLSEYRERQRVRAHGLVKERVEKFEEIDDQTSKEKAELAAIEAARAEAQGKADWTYKHEVHVAGEVNDAVESLDKPSTKVESEDAVDYPATGNTNASLNEHEPEPIGKDNDPSILPTQKAVANMESAVETVETEAVEKEEFVYEGDTVLETLPS